MTDSPSPPNGIGSLSAAGLRAHIRDLEELIGDLRAERDELRADLDSIVGVETVNGVTSRVCRDCGRHVAGADGVRTRHPDGTKVYGWGVLDDGRGIPTGDGGTHG